MGEGPPPLALVCPRCGGREVVVSAAVASACLPFPELRPLRCAGCGQEGTWARIGGRDEVRWGAPLRR